MIEFKKIDFQSDDGTFDTCVAIQMELDVDRTIKLIEQNGLDSVSESIGKDLLKIIIQKINRGN